MTSTKLNGLSLMFIRHDLTKYLNIADDFVSVDEFAREHPIRMELVNLLNDDEKLSEYSSYA